MLKNLLQVTQNCFKKRNSKNLRRNRDLIGNKVADKITKAPKTLPPDNPEAVANEEERYFQKKNRKL